MKVSVVIPVYNEEDSLPILHKSIHEALDRRKEAWEIIYVNDGSTDSSLNILAGLSQEDPNHTRVVSLMRNFGQTTAINAGLDHADGDIIVMMDADLQNDPADIPMLITKIEEGYDLVSGWRKSRKDNFFIRTFPSMAANKLISGVTGVHLHDYGCTLKAYRKKIFRGFKLYGEMHRFIPAYAGWAGAKILEVPVTHHSRKYGKTNYGLERTLKVVLDLITLKFLLSYSQKPIYIFGGTGLGLISASGILISYLVGRRLVFGEHLIRSPLLLMATMFFILGFQAILLGLIAELLVRTYHEAQAKPTYVLESKINFGDDNN